MNSNIKMTIKEKYEDCCIALNSVTEELEVYKRAIYLLADHYCSNISYSVLPPKGYVDYFIQKARGEENDT